MATGTVVEPVVSVKLIVFCCTASLKVAVTFAPTATPVAPMAGERLVTVGATASAAAAVVYVQETLVITLPDRSWAPLKVAVYVVAYARFPVGSSVTTCVEGLYVTATGTIVEPVVSVKLIVFCCTA